MSRAYPVRPTVVRLALALVSVSGLTACEPKRSSDIDTSQLRPSINIHADHATGVADVVGSVSVARGDNDFRIVRLVNGDRLAVSWDNESRTLYRRQEELSYRARLPVGRSNRLQIGFYRKSSGREDAPDSIVLLPDIDSFSVDEALQTLNTQSTLTLRWTDDPTVASNNAPEVTATAMACVNVFGESANTTLSMMPAGRVLLRDAAGNAQVNMTELTSAELISADIAQCDWAIQLSVSSDTVQTDPALHGLDVSATSVSAPIIVTVDYTAVELGS